MPLSDAVARLNRRVTNPLLRHLVGRVPTFASVTHRGRKSGRSYTTPVMAFPAGPGPNRWVIALTYGRERDWVHNVVAAGEADLVTRGHDVHLVHPRIVRGTDAALPLFVRAVLRLSSVTDFLELDVARRVRAD